MCCRDRLESVDFWNEIHLKLTYLYGNTCLTGNDELSPQVDAIKFLLNCDDRNFLDFVKHIFTTRSYFYATNEINFVKDFNIFLLQDELPYAITDFVWNEVQNGSYSSTKTIITYPKVICKDSEVLYSTAIQPTLQILREPKFNSANKEFLGALEDFRKADYGDCLVKCGSAIESVLKIICNQKNWPYQSNDTASRLLNIVINNSNLEPFFEQPLILVATIRNKLSNAHGAGLTPRNVSKAKAEYTINATASAILLLVAEAG